MPNNPLVLNLTREYCLSFKQARKAVENCSAEWVEFGVSIRNLNVQEKIAALNERARQREIGKEVLISPEVPGLKFAAPQTNYVAPSRELYEELEDPLAVRTCRWPRKSVQVLA